MTWNGGPLPKTERRRQFDSSVPILRQPLSYSSTPTPHTRCRTLGEIAARLRLTAPQQHSTKTQTSLATRRRSRMEEHLEHVVEECRGFPYARAREMAPLVLKEYVRRHGGDDNTNDKEELIRRLQACFQEKVSRPLPGDALATPPWWDKPKPQRLPVARRLPWLVRSRDTTLGVFAVAVAIEVA